MRLHLDAARNTISVFAASDSLRSDEGTYILSSVMADASGPLTRLVLRTQDGNGWIDIDDLRWEQVTYWVGGAADTNWSTAANWNPKVVPDSNSLAIFDGSSLKGCALDRSAAVGSMTIATAYKGRIALQANTLSITRNAVFSGGSWSALAGGAVSLDGPRGQSLGAASGSPAFPPLVHAGAGTLRLDAPVLAPSFSQLRGALDFNGKDLSVTGDLIVRNGRPETFIRLYGRTLTAGNSARFEGTSKDTLLGLDPMGEQQWTVSVPTGKSLTADLALISMAVASGARGYATRSLDASGNQGWTFVTGTAFAQDPRDTTVRVGDTAVFRVALTDSAGASLQWYRDGVAVQGATASTLRLAPARLRDHGVRFTCKATTLAGTLTSAAAVARVEFPVPTISPAVPEVIDTVRVTATSYHPEARIFISIDGAAFKETRSVLVTAPATVRALHVVHGDTSTSAVQAYVKIAVKPRLLPGEEQSLPGGLTLVRPSGAATGVDVQVATPTLSAPGFRDIASVFSVTDSGRTLGPGLEFSLKAGSEGSLYHSKVGGGIVPMPPGRPLTEPGLYFVGVDTAAPALTRLEEEFLAGDSTRVTFVIRDNTAWVQAEAEGVAGSSDRLVRLLASGDTLRAAFKNGSPCLGPLAVRLKVSDLRNTATFPSTQGGVHELPQRVSATRCTPILYAPALDPEEPWELFSVPLAAETPLTYAALKSRNPDSRLEARTWSLEDGPRPMAEGAAFSPGRAYWLGSGGGRGASLLIPPHTSSPFEDPDSRKLSLRRGWNLVGNPSLSTLHWPVTHKGTLRWDLSPLKVPHAYDSEIGDWTRSDSLVPWRGYFVYNNGGDTVVTLLRSPLPPLPAKRAASDLGTTITLGIHGVTLRLGAAPEALDGQGPEDEAAPPAASGKRNRAGRLVATLNPGSPGAGIALAADIRTWKPDRVLSWRAVAAPPSARTETRAGRPDTGERGREDSLHVPDLALPEGHAAYILFRSRGLRAPLVEGAAFPLLPGFADSLEILAGPAALLAKRIAALPALPADFAASARGSLRGFHLDLALVAPGRVTLTLHALDGRTLFREETFLPAGRHRIERPLPGLSASRGLRILRVDFLPALPGPAPASKAIRILTR
jgi:hypothetical protein